MKREHVKAQLRFLEMRPSKRKGQNFLTDEDALAEIISFGAPQPGESFLEIGAGFGALSAELLKFGSVTAIELEPEFCEFLKENFPTLKVVEKDFRTLVFEELIEEGSSGTAPTGQLKLVIFGNIPYSISSDIIKHLLNQRKLVSRAVLLLQKEFAERIAAQPGSRAYGSLSVAAQLRAKISLGPTIKAQSFHPVPKVDSRLLKLEFYGESPYVYEDEKWLELVVRAAFSKRRKKLTNSLLSSGRFSKQKLMTALEQSHIDGGRRAETLSIEEFIKLADSLRQ